MRLTMNAAAPVLGAALIVGTACPAQEFGLRYYRIASNAPTEITISPAEQVQNPQYRVSDLQWKPLAVKRTDRGTVFTLPVDAGGASVVLLHKPDWLTLPHSETPVMSAVAVDNLEFNPDGDTVQVGRLPDTPGSITLTVADETNIYLRTTSKGTILFDDVSLEPKR